MADTEAVSIQTVTGPIRPEDLGQTLVHEHVLIDMYAVSLDSRGILADEAVAVDELRLFRVAGGTTLVDQTTIGLYPDPVALARISLATGVSIVAGTGVYWRRFRPAWVDGWSMERICDRMTQDLTLGFADTTIRAGLIGEIATGHRDIDGVESRVFRAAAAAQRVTGAAIATHALFTRIGLQQLDVLEDGGADIGRVAIGHADTCPDVGYHRRVLERGAWLAFDTVGQTDKDSDEHRATRLADLAAAGYLDRLLVSSDVCKQPALVRNGGGGYGLVLNTFVPLLHRAGFSAREVTQLLVDNPRRFLTPSR